MCCFLQKLWIIFKKGILFTTYNWITWISRLCCLDSSWCGNIDRAFIIENWKGYYVICVLQTNKRRLLYKNITINSILVNQYEKVYFYYDICLCRQFRQCHVRESVITNSLSCTGIEPTAFWRGGCSEANALPLCQPCSQNCVLI